MPLFTGLAPSFVSPELREDLARVFGPVGRATCALAADPSDLLNLLGALRAVPAPLTGEAPSCLVATGVDAGRGVPRRRSFELFSFGRICSVLAQSCP